MEMSEPIEEDEDEAALKAAMTMSLGGNSVPNDISGVCRTVHCSMMYYHALCNIPL